MRIDQVILIGLLAAALASSALLTCAPPGQWQPGMQDWPEGSWLRPIVQLLNVGQARPTQRGVELKSLIFRLGACAAAALGAICWLVRLARSATSSASLVAAATCNANGTNHAPPDSPADHTGRTLAILAELLLAGYVAWAALSTGWSGAPRQAAGYAATVLFIALWAIPLGRILDPRSARLGLWLAVVIAAVASALGIAHHYVRSPQLRLSYPIGNPLFAAAFLIGPLAVAAAYAIQRVAELARSRRWPTATVAWLTLVGLCLTLICWAVVLTRSRGTALGLAVGALAAGVWLQRSRRRRLMVGLVAAACLCVGGWWGWQQVRSGPRAASVRFRLYAWRYGLRMLAARPVAGDGGGTYGRLVHEMAATDEWRDPLTMAGQLVDHAHNEWLESLADLGLVGGGAWAGCWLVTIAGLWRAAARRGAGRPGWLLAGLGVALAGLFVEEATDVALRRPGAAAMAATLLGLSWACLRGGVAGRTAAVAGGPWPLGRAAAAAAVLGLAGLGARLAWGDWQAARACYEGRKALLAGKFGQAEAMLRLAAAGRLEPSRRLVGLHYRLEAMTEAARAKARQAERARRGQGHDAAAWQVAARQADAVAREGLSLARYVERIAPGFGYVRSMGAELAEVRAAVAAWRGQLEQGRTFQADVRRWLRLANARRPADERVAMRLVATLGADQMAEALRILRGPMRGGRPSQRFRAMLAGLSRQDGFEAAMERLMADARAAEREADPSRWADESAAETLRLAGMVAAVQGRAGQAVELARRSAGLYGRLGQRFSHARAMALQDASQQAFVAEPDRPQRAIELARAALAALGQRGARSLAAAGLRRDVALYLVAAGDEQGAREQLGLVAAAVSPERRRGVEAELGATYERLVVMFARAGPERRPRRFERWLERARRLRGDSVQVQLAVAQVALERGDEQEASAALRRAEELSEDDEAVGRFVAEALRRWPNSAALRAYRRSKEGR